MDSQHVDACAALNLVEQFPDILRVDVPGVPPVTHELPLSGPRVLRPLRLVSPPAGLIDAQDLYLAQRLPGDVTGLDAEGPQYGQPGPVRVPCDLDVRGAVSRNRRPAASCSRLSAWQWPGPAASAR